MKNLSGKVAAITGAASGIGQATAVLLAKEGCSLAISDVNLDGLEETKKLIEAIGAKVHVAKLDVADKDAMHQWADDVVAEFGSVNLIVNNAGVALGATIEHMSYEDFEWLININFMGMVYGTKAFLPHLKNADAGHIVNISSVAGFLPTPALSAYTAAKFGIRGFTECLRVELDLDDDNVSATSVHPGGIQTNIARDARVSIEELAEADVDQETITERFAQIALSTPETAAKKIVAGIKNNKRRVLVGPDAYLFDLAARLFPITYQKLLVLNLKIAGWFTNRNQD